MVDVLHGDADKAANSGRGVHPVYGRPDVADEAARLALVQNASDAGRYILQTGGDRPGGYELLGTTGQSRFVGQGKTSETVATKTQANDGETFTVGTLWIAELDSGAGDWEGMLPEISNNNLRDGDVVEIIVSGHSAGIARLQVSRQGGDTIVGGMGVGNSALTSLYLQGQYDLVRFTADKANFEWHVQGLTRDYGTALKWPCIAATTEALPTFNAVGSGAEQTLTATANGELVIDGLPASFYGAADFREGILVAAENGSNRTYHGAWDLVDAGSAGTPWILRRRTDFATARCTAAGVQVYVTSGLINGGRVFVEGSETSFPTTGLIWRKRKTVKPVVYDAVQLTANANDYDAPVNGAAQQGEWLDADIVRLDASMAVNITGFVPSDTIRVLVNVSAFTITLTHQDVASVAANRTAIAGGGNLAVPPDGTATLWYDHTSNINRII